MREKFKVWQEVSMLRGRKQAEKGDVLDNKKWKKNIIQNIRKRNIKE